VRLPAAAPISNKSRTSLCGRVPKTQPAWGSTRATCQFYTGAWQKSDAPALQAGSSGSVTRRLSASAPLLPLSAHRPKRGFIFHRAASRLKPLNIWQWPRSRNPLNNGSAFQSAKWRFDRGKCPLLPSALRDRPAKSAACFSGAPREFGGPQCFSAAIDASFSQR